MSKNEILLEDTDTIKYHFYIPHNAASKAINKWKYTAVYRVPATNHLLDEQ